MVRVVVNQSVTLSPKTGIGHYTAELLRCLRRQGGEDEIAAFPNGWMRRLRGTASRLRSHLEPKGGNQPSAPSSPPRQMKSQALEYLRQCDHCVTARYLQFLCNRRGYQIYHE